MGNPSPFAPILYPTTLALLLLLTTATLDEHTHALDRHFETLIHQKTPPTTLTKLQIYIHAIFNTSYPNQTVFQVASSSITPTSASSFGRILVIDNHFTTGPDPKSRQLGRYQGLNAYSDFKEAAATMSMNIIFSEGSDYDGSTLCIMGRQPVNEEVRVLSVLGGTGAFRLAAGTLLATTYSSDPSTQTGVYVYVMYILTPAGGSVQVA